MSETVENVLVGMTAKDAKALLMRAEAVKTALINVAKEFIKKTQKGSNYWVDTSSDASWRLEEADCKNDTYLVVYEWYCKGDTEDVDYYIPYRAIDDMDGTVKDFLEAKAREEEEARQQALADAQLKEAAAEQAEYEEFLRLKKKYENH